MEILKSIDAMTVIVALATVGLNAAIRIYRGDPEWTSRKKASIDLLNGATLVPFFVLIMCVFSDSALKELIEHGKAFVSLAGS